MSYSMQPVSRPYAGAPMGLFNRLGTSKPSSIAADIIATVLAGYRGAVAVRLWNGTLAHGHRSAATTIVFRRPGALRDLIVHRKPVADCGELS